MEESKWIIAKERLPEVNVNVLLFTGMGGDDDYMIGHLNENGWFWDEEAHFLHVPVTHWQPLPSPPQDPVK